MCTCLAHDQAPSLLQGGKQHQPGLGIDLLFAFLRHMPLEDDDGAAPFAGGIVVQLGCPPTITNHAKYQVGVLLAKSSGHVNGMFDLLVWHQPANHADGWVGGFGLAPAEDRISAVVDHTDPLRVHPKRGQLGFGGL